MSNFTPSTPNSTPNSPAKPARMIERVVPQSLEAEQATLGAMMMESEALFKGASQVQDNDFYREIHKKIFNALCHLGRTGQPVDLITVVEELRRRNQLEEIGGTSYLTALLEACPSSANIGAYITVVLEKSCLRGLLRAAEDITNSVYNHEEKADTITRNAEKRVFDLAQSKGGATYAKSSTLVGRSWAAITERYLDKRPITGIPTGFTEFDEMTMGLQPGELYVFGAPPGAGKTNFVCNVTSHVVLREHLRALFFSFEMTADQLIRRIVCAEATVSDRNIRRGYLDGTHLDNLAVAHEQLAKSELIIVEERCTPSQMFSMARRIIAEHGKIDMIVVDYIHIVIPENPNSREDQQLSETTCALHDIARFFKIPVLAISATNNESQKREIGDPQMHDARGSSGIQYNTDTMIMLKPQPNKEFPEDDKENGVLTKFHFVKNRFGGPGSIDLRFQGKYARFVNVATEEQEQQARSNGYRNNSNNQGSAGYANGYTPSTLNSTPNRGGF